MRRRRRICPSLLTKPSHPHGNRRGVRVGAADFHLQYAYLGYLSRHAYSHDPHLWGFILHPLVVHRCRRIRTDRHSIGTHRWSQLQCKQYPQAGASPAVVSRPQPPMHGLASGQRWCFMPWQKHVVAQPPRIRVRRRRCGPPHRQGLPSMPGCGASPPTSSTRLTFTIRPIHASRGQSSHHRKTSSRIWRTASLRLTPA